MKITLEINNKQKTFIAPFVKARLLKETLGLSKKVQDGFDENTFDDLGEYLVKVYGNKFTLDELMDGYPANKFFKKAIADMEEIIGNFDNSIKN